MYVTRRRETLQTYGFPAQLYNMATTTHILPLKYIVRNGFKKAGIISAIEDGVEQVALVADATLESDKDLFDSDNVSGADDVDI